MSSFTKLIHHKLVLYQKELLQKKSIYGKVVQKFEEIFSRQL
jgi:hypothetical protein